MALSDNGTSSRAQDFAATYNISPGHAFGRCEAEKSTLQPHDGMIEHSDLCANNRCMHSAAMSSHVYASAESFIMQSRAESTSSIDALGGTSPQQAIGCTSTQASTCTPAARAATYYGGSTHPQYYHTVMGNSADSEGDESQWCDLGPHSFIFPPPPHAGDSDVSRDAVPAPLSPPSCSPGLVHPIPMPQHSAFLSSPDRPGRPGPPAPQRQRSISAPAWLSASIVGKATPPRPSPKKSRSQRRYPRSHTCREPVRSEFGSEEAYRKEWDLWRAIRNVNNEAVSHAYSYSAC